MPVDFADTVPDVEDRRFIEIVLDGVECAAWARGPVGRTDTAVVLLHDRAMNACAWDLVMRRMPAGVAIVAPDLRGRGSAWRLRPSTGVDHHVADVSAMLDQLDVDHALVVGHGLGAVVADALQRQVPDRAVLTIGVVSAPQASAPEAHATDPFAAAIGRTFRDRLEHGRGWRANSAMAGLDVEHVDGFLAHGISGLEDRYQWRVDRASLEADDVSAAHLRSHGFAAPPSFARAVVVGSGSLPDPGTAIADRVGQLVCLPAADPATVLLTSSGADAVAAVTASLLGP